MKITIDTAPNGYVLSVDGEYVQIISDEKGEVQAGADLLRDLTEHLGLAGSRHDEKRIYVTVAPGDKHDDFTGEMSNVFFGEEG